MDSLYLDYSPSKFKQTGNNLSNNSPVNTLTCMFNDLIQAGANVPNNAKGAYVIGVRKTIYKGKTFNLSDLVNGFFPDVNLN